MGGGQRRGRPNTALGLPRTVVYTGKDTKVMKKSGGARSKMSQVERTMNNCIKIIFLAQVSAAWL